MSNTRFVSADHRIAWLLRALCLVSGMVSAMYAMAADELAPDWSLAQVGGGEVAFHDQARGAPAVLFFWASWCPHCSEALPVMEALYRQYAPRGVHFYALDIWEDGDAVAYFRAHDYHLPLFLAADLVAEDYGIEGTPGIVVVDQELRIVDLDLDGVAPATIAARLGEYLRVRTADRSARTE